MAGFSFDETMSGTWTRAGSTDEHAISFTVRAQAHSWLRHLRDRKARLEGTMTVEGLAAGVPTSGELTMDPVWKRIIRYDLSFKGDDGRRYRLLGQKDVAFTDLVATMTTLPAALTDDTGAQVGQALLHFDKKDLPGFLASFRPRL